MRAEGQRLTREQAYGLAVEGCASRPPDLTFGTCVANAMESMGFDYHPILGFQQKTP